VQYSGIWKDLRTWNTLAEAMDNENLGQAITGNCENTHIVNELNIPIVALGLKNAIVAASPDGILVSDKGESSFLKDYVTQIDRRLMYEEHSWGAFTVLDDSSYEDGSNVSIRRFFIKAGHKSDIVALNGAVAVLTFSSGLGRALIDGRLKDVAQGNVVTANTGAYIIEALTDLFFIEILTRSDEDEESADNGD
jgi:mannose-1-phosphate guanylyltransferase